MRCVQAAGRAAAAMLAVLLAASGAAGAGATPQRQGQADAAKSARPGPGLYAHVRTEAGTFTFRLLDAEAPKTVANFVGLADGTIDPATGKPGEGPHFYDGLTFHRAVRGFIIQGGDPKGDGTGGPGYTIPDEIASRTRTFNQPGLVAMATAGPNGGGSQFFVTLVPAPSLNGKFTIFGEVVDGMDVVRRIAGGKTQTLPSDRLVAPVRIVTIRIDRVNE